MKTYKILKRILFSLVALLAFIGCKSTPDTDAVKPETKEDVAVEQKHEVKDTTTVEEEPDLTIAFGEQTPEDEEYNRSVQAIETGEVISQDTFKEDKKAILETIKELDTIMKNKDYRGWLNYVTPQSANYWSQKTHLQAVSARLPGNRIQLKTLEDYFNWVFRPSRLNKRVDEIRYISSSLVKAVQVDGNQDTIYYKFEKQNGKWLIALDME